MGCYPLQFRTLTTSAPATWERAAPGESGGHWGDDGVPGGSGRLFVGLGRSLDRHFSYLEEERNGSAVGSVAVALGLKWI